MTTSYDLSELQALLHTLPARLRLVADYVSREDALEPPLNCWMNAPRGWKPSATGSPFSALPCKSCQSVPADRPPYPTRLPAISEFSDSWSYGPAPCFLPDIPEGWAFSAAMTITGPSHG